MGLFLNRRPGEEDGGLRTTPPACPSEQAAAEIYRISGGGACKQWSGAESNRRHTDFQSVALPTELPDPKGRLVRSVVGTVSGKATLARQHGPSVRPHKFFSLKRLCSGILCVYRGASVIMRFGHDALMCCVKNRAGAVPGRGTASGSVSSFPAPHALRPRGYFDQRGLR